MTLSEILKAKGIADDVAQSVLDDMKANKIFTASEDMLTISLPTTSHRHS